MKVCRRATSAARTVVKANVGKLLSKLMLADCCLCQVCHPSLLQLAQNVASRFCAAACIAAPRQAAALQSSHVRVGGADRIDVQSSVAL